MLFNVIFVNGESERKNAQNNFYRFGYLSTNDTIAKFTPNDLDLIQVPGELVIFQFCKVHMIVKLFPQIFSPLERHQR